MLRFIMKNKVKNQFNGLESERIFTIDVDVPAVEAALLSGGQSESGYDETSLIGIEVKPNGN